MSKGEEVRGTASGESILASPPDDVNAVEWVTDFEVCTS